MTRPLCPVCLAKPTKPGKATCGRSCGVALQWRGDRWQSLDRRRRRLAPIQEGRRAQVRRYLVAKFGRILGDLEAAGTSAGKARILAKFYREARHAEYMRWSRWLREREVAS